MQRGGSQVAQFAACSGCVLWHPMGFPPLKRHWGKGSFHSNLTQWGAHRTGKGGRQFQQLLIAVGMF